MTRPRPWGGRQRFRSSVASTAVTRPHPIQWLREHPYAADVILACLMTFFIVGGLLTIEIGSDGGSNRELDLLGWLLAISQGVLLAFRRKAPVAALITSTVLLIPYWVLDYVDPATSIVVLLLLYAAAAHGPRPAAARAAFACGAILVVVMTIGVFSAEEDLPAIAVVANLVIFGTAWILGDSLRNRRAYLAEVEARAVRAEQDRAADMAQAVQAERDRIARELHDVVAHSVSVMVVQAGAARRVIETHPDQTTESLGIIESTGRSALDELRRLLGVLRDPDANGRTDPALEPQPGAGDIDDLIAQWQQTGLDVRLETSGSATDLPSGIGLTAYRVVQEALTNAMKHAGPAEVVVRVSYRDREVDLEVTDDGRGLQPGASELSTGHGLLGMAERVDLFGGSLHAGPRPGGGFRVAATLPLDSATSPSR